LGIVSASINRGHGIQYLPDADNDGTLTDGTGSVGIGGYDVLRLYDSATDNRYGDLTRRVLDAANRTWYLPDYDGDLMVSTLAGNEPQAANSIWAESNALVFEGLTANDWELFLVPPDVAADATITMPSATGTLALTTDIPVTFLTAGGEYTTLPVYLSFTGTEPDTTENDVLVRVPVAFTASNLCCSISPSISDGIGTQQVTVTLRKNGASDTLLQVAIDEDTPPAQYLCDNTGTVSFAAADRLALIAEDTATGTPVAAHINCTMRIR
jgi:hypothetical protein